MPVCTRCHKDTGLLGRLNFNKQANRYGKCEQEVETVLSRGLNLLATIAER